MQPRASWSNFLTAHPRGSGDPGFGGGKDAGRSVEYSQTSERRFSLGPRFRGDERNWVGRRRLLIGAGTVLFSAPAWAGSTRDFAAIEAGLGGRLGVHAFERGGPRRLSYRAGERFPMCSTFKALLVGAVLEKTDQGALSLARRIPYTEADLLEYAPIARAHLAEGGLTVQALCEAAVELSDNTAANLLIALIGGPAALTARLRAWGDAETRLDRNEPSLNSAIPGDPRDTTTPAAMAASLERLIYGAVLKPGSRALLKGWMVSCKTGLTKLRAGLPAGGTIGDKTGNNGHDTEGDNAFVEIGGRTVVMSVYLAWTKVDQKAQDAAIAEVAGLIAAQFGLVRP